MVNDNARGRSRTPRSGTSTVTSKSSLVKQDDDGENLIDRVPTAYDYHSACSEDEWLDEKSKASRYSVGGKNDANRTKSLMSDDDEEEEEADEDRDEAYDHFDCGDENRAGDVGSVDKYSHSSKKRDKGNDTKRPTTIDRLWSASMDSDTQQFQGVAYKGSVFGGGFDGNDAKKKKASSAQLDDKETNPTMLEPIYDTPRKKKPKKSMATRLRNSITIGGGNGAGDQTKTSENNSKQTANKSTSDTKGKSTVSGTTTSSKRELKKKPTDEISTEIDGSITSSLTDPLEHMLLNSKSDPNKVVRDIETKLDLLRAMAAEVDEKQRTIKDKKKKGKGLTDDKPKKSSTEKIKGEKETKGKSASKTKKSSSSRSRSRSKSRSRSESQSRSRSESQRRKSSSSKTGKKHTSTSDSATSRSRSRSRTTKRTSSSSAKDSNGTTRSKTPKIPIAPSDAVFSNAPTEHRKNSSSKEVSKEQKARNSDASRKERRSAETKEKKKTTSSSSSRKSSQSQSGSRSRSRSRSVRKSSDGHSLASSRRSRSSSKRHRSSSSKTSRARSQSSRHRSSSTRDRSSSQRRKSTKERSRSQSRKSKSGESRSQSRHSTQSERSRSKKSKSRKRTDGGVTKKKKKKSTQFKGSKYLMDTDLKEESVERARYELTQEMIELLEKVKLEEMQKKNKVSNDKTKDTRLFKKRKDILNNFANFFRKSKKNEEVIISSPHSVDSFTDNDAYNTDYSASHKKSRRSGASECDTYTESKIIKIGTVASNDYDDENDENDPDDVIESDTCGTSLKENGTRSTNNDKSSNGANILGESNKQQATKPLSAEKTKKATDLRKAAIKQAAARKLAAAEKQKAAEEAKKKAKLEAKAKAKAEKKSKKSKKSGEKLEESAPSKRDDTILKGRTNDTSSMKSDEVENDETTTGSKVSEKKAKVVKRFAADKKKALHGETTSKNASSDQNEAKDFTDAVEATRSVSDWESKQNDSVVKRISTGGKKNNEKGTKKKRASMDATDNESKTTMTTVTKIPEHLVTRSNPLEIDEYSFTKELANEPGMVQCLRFYSCGRTADVLNVAIHVSDTCTGNDDYQYPANNLKKYKSKKSKYGNNDHGDAILQNRSIVTETEDYPTNASIIESPPRHMPTVEVILEEETNPLVMQQVVPRSPPEQRDDMARSYGTLTDSDDESLEEAPELKMARVQSFILDVSQMKLHLDEDSQEKRTRDAIRRGIASAEEISITSIQVPTFDVSSKEPTIDTVSDDARDDADNGDGDDSSTESGVVDEDSVSHSPETPTNKSKGRRVQQIFSRFRNIRKSKKIFSM